jgi:hypothetical protein
VTSTGDLFRLALRLLPTKPTFAGGFALDSFLTSTGPGHRPRPVSCVLKCIRLVAENPSIFVAGSSRLEVIFCQTPDPSAVRKMSIPASLMVGSNFLKVAEVDRDPYGTQREQQTKSQYRGDPEGSPSPFQSLPAGQNCLKLLKKPGL